MHESNIDLELNEIEQHFERKALEALKLHDKANRINYDYLRMEAAGLHDDLLFHPGCPPLWCALLSMSKATLDPANWKQHVSSALKSWQASKRPNSGAMWHMLTAWLFEVVDMIAGKSDSLNMYPLGPNIQTVLPVYQRVHGESPKSSSSGSVQSTSHLSSPGDAAESSGMSTPDDSMSIHSSEGQHCSGEIASGCEMLKEAFATLEVPSAEIPALDALTILLNRSIRKETLVDRGYWLDQWNQPTRIIQQPHIETSPIYVTEIQPRVEEDPSNPCLKTAWSDLFGNFEEADESAKRACLEQSE